MPEMNDMELLRDYARHGSEAAFAELVRRHLNLVYSVALRHVGAIAPAEEITQAVFIILARKAASLRPNTVLEGWLHTTTRLTAMSHLRGERRRQFREQEAYMQSTLQESNEAAWQQLTPLLDEGISKLGQTDRDAVVLRFFKDKNIPEIAAALEVSEAAAQRRVLRAVEKLRTFFSKRGVTLTAAALTGAVMANSMQAAPAGLAASVVAGSAKGATISATLTTLVKGTMKTMTWLKIKFAAGIGVAAVLVGSAVTVAHSGNKLISPAGPVILITSKFVIVPSANFKTANGKTATREQFTSIGLLTSAERESLMKAFEKAAGFELLSTPQVTTRSGMPAEISITDNSKLNGTNAQVGIILQVSPQVSTKFASAIDLTATAELRELVDMSSQHGGSQLAVRTTKAEGTVTLREEQTLVLTRPIENSGQPVKKNKADVPGPKTLMVFVNVTLVDEFGNVAKPKSEDSFKQENLRQLNAARQLALACIMFADAHKESLPTSFEQTKPYLKGSSPAASDWELASSGRLNSGEFPSPDKSILLREKQARRSPTGQTVKIYAFADGHSELVTCPDGDFTAVEKQRGFLIHPAKN